MADILLATKIHIPPLHHNLVDRAHLIHRLNEGVSKSRLTIVSAPAGYGKSTLLSEWVSRLDIPVAWLSLERGENFPARFWKYFITSLREIPQVRQAGIGESLSQLLDSSQPATLEVELATLVNSLSGLEERVIMVLDDMHHITETQIHHDLVFLIDHLKSSIGGLHLVVAGRMDPPWPLARWRAHGELSEFHASDLRFDFDETALFFHQHLQSKLSTQDIATLQDRTEGWIAGLQMAAVSMQRRLITQGPQGVSRFIESFSGSNRFILDYLMEEVISQQPAEIQDFLLGTSILEQLTASLCNTLVDRQDSQSILEQLEKAHLFLIPLDDERQWYRYHHLFAELLHKWLKETRPDRILELHRRASTWFAANNQLTEAINHALDGGDTARVNELVSGNTLAMLEKTELVNVLRRFQEIPDHHLSSKPWLHIAYAWVLAYTGHFQAAALHLRCAESTSSPPSSLDHRILGHSNTIRSYMSTVEGQMSRADEFARRALELLPETDYMARGFATMTLGMALRFSDHLPEAERVLTEAVAINRAAGDNHVTVIALCDLAFVQYVVGKVHKAHGTYQEALRLADAYRHVSGRRLPVIGYVYVHLSTLLLEWNELEESLRLARLGVELCQQWGWTELLVDSYMTLAFALSASGDVNRALEAIQQARNSASSLSEWYLVKIVEPPEVLIHLKLGDLDFATRWLEGLENPASTTDQSYVPFDRVVRLRVKMALGQLDQALTMAKECCQISAKSGATTFSIVNLVLQAVIFHLKHQEDQALKVLGQALQLAEPEGYIRTFIDQGRPMAELLWLASNRGIAPVYAKKLLSAFGPEFRESQVQPHPDKLRAYNLEPISDRELEVLRLLNTRLSTPEIAREMILAPSTIRTHVRNIYEKLGTHGRIETIQKAKELGLI